MSHCLTVDDLTEYERPVTGPLDTSHIIWYELDKLISKWLLVRQEARSQSGLRQLGSVTIARSRVRVRAGYEFVSSRRHGDQRLPAGPIVTANLYT